MADFLDARPNISIQDNVRCLNAIFRLDCCFEELAQRLCFFLSSIKLLARHQTSRWQSSIASLSQSVSFSCFLLFGFVGYGYWSLVVTTRRED